MRSSASILRYHNSKCSISASNGYDKKKRILVRYATSSGSGGDSTSPTSPSSASATTSKRNYALSYLQTWVNKKTTKEQINGIQESGLVDPSSSMMTSSPNNNTTSTTSSTRIPSSYRPLKISGASYLLPTLRLDRTDTPESLSDRLGSLLGNHDDDERAGLASTVRAMLLPTTTRTTSTTNDTTDLDNNNIGKEITKTTWRAPIILDMKAFQHDGSPHYKAPPYGSLTKFVHVLNEWGMKVMGVANITLQNDNKSTIVKNGERNKTTMEQEAIELGMPLLMSRAGRTLGGTRTKTNSDALGASSLSSSSMAIEDLVQLVLTQVKEESTSTTIEKVSTNDSDLQQEESKDNQKESILPSMLKKIVMDTSFTTTATEATTNDESTNTVNTNNESATQISDNGQHNQSSSTPISQSQSQSTFPTITANAKIYHGSVRSGQQISSEQPNQSLVILGNVNSGGEVMSEGDLFIFGKLRGRALAGLATHYHRSNDDDDDDNDEGEREGEDEQNESKIFASSFDPELVCIGESFTTVDSVEDFGLKPAEGALVSVDEYGELKFTAF